MRVFLSLAFLTILITSCSQATSISPSPIPTTVIIVPTLTSIPIPTKTPTPTETPPAVLQNLHHGFFAVRNTDNSWGVGVENSDKTEAIPGISTDATGAKLELTLADGTKVDILPSQISASGDWVNDNGNIYSYDSENKVWTLEISQDLAHPENLPKIALEEITSPEFAQKFLDAAKAGKLPKAPPTAITMPIRLDYYTDEGQKMIAHYGLVGMFSFNTPKATDSNINLTDLSQRFNYVVSGYQVAASNGEIAYAIIMGYVNKSSPDGYWGYLFRPENSKDTVQELNYYFPGNRQAILTTAEYLANEKGVRAYLGNFGKNPNSAFGDWYLKTLGYNSAMLSEISVAMKDGMKGVPIKAR